MADKCSDAEGTERATITLTMSKDAGIEKDSDVNEASSGSNYGAASNIIIGGNATGVDRRHGLMTVSLPEKPDDCDDSEDYDGIVSIILKLYLASYTSTSASPHDINVVQVAPAESWAEMTVTWSNKPSTGVQISQNNIVLSTGYKDFVLTLFRELGLTWGETLDFYLWNNRDQAAKFSNFSSRDEGTISILPYLVITYKQLPPEQITDLAIIPDPNDTTRPKLTWTPSTDDKFSYYQVCRKVGAGTWDQLGSDITVKGQGEFVDNTGGLTENQVIYYRVMEVNTDGSWMRSNEVWMIRPDVSTFTVSDTTPDVLQNLTFTVAAVAYPSTPTPVTQEWYEFYFGTTVQADASSCRIRELTRTHRYPHYGSQTPKVQIENSLGFKSELEPLTTGGPTLTVTDVVPVAIIRASPVVVGVNDTIRFFADESYCPAGNREIASSNGYEWDKDYSVSFSADDITTLPYKDYSWASSGTKTVAMRVKDAGAKYATHVTIQVSVVTVTTVDLDTALTDGYETIDADVARTIAITEGMQVKKMTRGSLKIIPVMIGGFAYTDTVVDGIPDDIETLQDIVSNNKRIQITVHGVVHYGSLNFKSHHEAGWLDKFNWVAQLYLE